MPYLVPPALSTLNGPRGLLGLLTLMPKFTGEKMQPLEQGEGSPRPPVISCAGSEPGDQGPGLHPLFPPGHGVWAGSRASCLQAPLPPSRDYASVGNGGNPKAEGQTPQLLLTPHPGVCLKTCNCGILDIRVLSGTRAPGLNSSTYRPCQGAHSCQLPQALADREGGLDSRTHHPDCSGT